MSPTATNPAYLELKVLLESNMFARVRNALAGAGILYLGQLCFFESKQLERLSGISKMTIATLRELLQTNGLSFAQKGQLLIHDPKTEAFLAGGVDAMRPYFSDDAPNLSEGKRLAVNAVSRAVPVLRQAGLPPEVIAAVLDSAVVAASGVLDLYYLQNPKKPRPKA